MSKSGRGGGAISHILLLIFDCYKKDAKVPLYIDQCIFTKCKKDDICEFAFSGPGVEKIGDEVKTLFANKKILIFYYATNRLKSQIYKLMNTI